MDGEYKAISPLLWASSYHADECLDPVDAAEAKAKKKVKKFAGRPPNGQSNRREPGILSKADGQTECPDIMPYDLTNSC